MKIDVTASELDLLFEILEERRRQLEVEINHTDRKGYKLHLREKEKLLDELMNKLTISRAVAA